MERALPTAALLVLGALTSCGAAEDAAPPPRLVQDARLAHLFAPCAQGGPYDVDTTAATAILVEVLERGLMDPLKQAKEELAELGGPALEEVRRSAERHWSLPYGEAYVRNAIDVATMASGPTARSIVLRGLRHPQQSVRAVALRGLRRHGRPEDFDLVLALMDTGEALQREAIPLLQGLDAERAEELYLAWVQDPDLAAVHPIVLPLLAASTAEATVARLLGRFETAPDGIWPYLAVPVAKAGDEAARALLRAGLGSDSPGRRTSCVQALVAGKLVDELVPTLLEDPDARLRLQAAGALAQAEPTPERDDALAVGSNDVHRGVRETCLSARVRRGDAAAIDQVQELLASDSLPALQDACRMLEPAWERGPDIARASLQRLARRDAELAHRPLVERARLLQAIGAIPLREAAEYLADVAAEAEGELQGMRAFRWILLRAGNAGPEGQGVLFEGFRAETDETRRIDWLEAASAAGGTAARDGMLTLLEEESTRPIETVYLADRLVRIGPLGRVAPALKRVTLRLQDPVARRALQCLLWTWYPGPRV